VPKGYPPERCDCQVCKSDNRYAQYSYNKFGREHHGACLCDKCVRSYAQHNASKTCECADCETHRHHLYTEKTVERIQGRKQGRKQGRTVHVATINLCGRKGCNAMMTSDAAGVIQLWRYPEDDDSKAFELCPACVADVVNLLDNQSIGDRQQAYKEPYKEPTATKSDDPLADVPTDDLERAFYSRKALEAGGVSDNLRAHLDSE
jgi:hypothetical protein